MSTITVQPEKVLKDLNKLWIDLAKEDKEKGAAGVLRACAMTLIVAVEEEADAQAASESIANLIHQHPARAIVMRTVPGDTDTFDARVLAQCWMPFGKRQQICCEEIEITVSRPRLADIPRFVLGLMAPDLPVVLVCRSESLARDAAFQQLFSLTDKIILDAASFGNPAEALGFIRDLQAHGRNIGDLAWTRLTPLREMVAQIFENERARKGLKTLKRVALTYSGPAAVEGEQLPVCLRYLSSWFQVTLGVPVERVYAGEGPGYAVRGIRMEGPDLAASVQVEDGHAAVELNGLSRRVALPRLSDCELLRDELSIVGVDSIYRRCLA